MVTADNMKRRVACIEKFFDDMLDSNAKSPHLPPMGYAEAEELARLTMERMGVPLVVGVVADYYRQVLNPGSATGHGGGDQYRDREKKEKWEEEKRLRDMEDRRAGDPGRGSSALNVARYVKGELVQDWKLLKIGRELVCREFQSGGCKRKVDGKGMGCLTAGGTVAHHVCAVIRDVMPGNVVRLCGGAHEGEKCKLKNP